MVSICWFGIQEQFKVISLLNFDFFIGQVVLTAFFTFYLDDTVLKDVATDLEIFVFLRNRLRVVAWIFFGISSVILILSLYLIRWPEGLPKYKPNLAQVVHDLPWKDGFKGILQRKPVFYLIIGGGYHIGISYYCSNIIPLVAYSAGYNPILTKFVARILTVVFAIIGVLITYYLLDKHIPLAYLKWILQKFGLKTSVPNKIKLTKVRLFYICMALNFFDYIIINFAIHNPGNPFLWTSF